MDLRKRERERLTYVSMVRPQTKVGRTLSLGWSLVILSTVIIVRIIFTRPLPLCWSINLPTGITIIVIFILFLNIFLLTVLLRFKITGIFLILGTAYWPDKVVSSQILL